MKNHNMGSVRQRILLSILLPVALFTLLMFTWRSMFLSVMQKLVVESHTEILTTISSSLNQMLNQTIMTADMLSFDNESLNLLYDEKTKYAGDIPAIYSVMNKLLRLKSASPLVDRVAIIRSLEGFVVSDTMTAGLDSYFGEHYVLSGYPSSFWQSYKVGSPGFEVLPPVTVTDHAQTKTVIPVLKSDFGQRGIGQKLLITIDCQKLQTELLNDSSTAENICFYDRESGSMFGGSEDVRVFFEDENFTNRLSEGSFEYENGSGRYIVTAYSDSYGVFSRISFVSALPQEQLLAEMGRVDWVMIVSFVAVTCLVLFLSLFLSSRLYAPIAELTRLMSEPQKDVDSMDIGNDFEFIRKRTCDLIAQNTEMTEKLGHVRSLMDERKIFRILSSTDLLEYEAMDEVFSEKGINFSNTMFVAAIVKIHYTDKFYEEYSREQFGVLNSKVHMVFTEMRLNGWETYSVLGDNGSLVIIVNIDDRLQSFEDVLETFDFTLGAFAGDAELIKISMGVGKPHADYAGMCTSYREAEKAILLLMGDDGSRFKVYPGESETTDTCVYSTEDSNKLVNCMLKGDEQEVRALIAHFVGKNLQLGVTKLGVRMLYAKFCGTAEGVLQSKGTDGRQLMQDRYINVDISITTVADNEFFEYVELFINETLEFVRQSGSGISISNVMRHIENNYTKDISLDSVADAMQLSPKYLSRMFKQSTGVNFARYVANVRVEKATELLRTTALSINDIASQTGFNSRNTFIRSFKEKEGILPSEYRSIHKVFPES